MTKTRLVFPEEVSRIAKAHEKSEFHSDAELEREAKILRACLSNPATPELEAEAVTLTGRVHTCMANNRVDVLVDRALNGDATAAQEAQELQMQMRFDQTNLSLLSLIKCTQTRKAPSFDFAELCYEIALAYWEGDDMRAEMLTNHLSTVDRKELHAMFPSSTGHDISHFTDRPKIVMQFLEKRTGQTDLASDQSLEEFFGARP